MPVIMNFLFLFTFLAIQLSTLSIVAARQVAGDAPIDTPNSLHSPNSRTFLQSNGTVNVHSHGLVARTRVPSTDELVAKIQESDKMGGKVPIFWSTFPSDAPYPEKGLVVSRQWARSRFGDCNIVMYDSCYTNEIFRQIKGLQLSIPQDLVLTNHMSKAYSRMVSGVIYLMVRDGLEPFDWTIWKTWEFPVITRRDQVEKVIKVEWPSLRESTYWTRGDGPRGQPPPPGKL